MKGKRPKLYIDKEKSIKWNCGSFIVRRTECILHGTETCAFSHTVLSRQIMLNSVNKWNKLQSKYSKINGIA